MSRTGSRQAVRGPRQAEERVPIRTVSSRRPLSPGRYSVREGMRLAFGPGGKPPFGAAFVLILHFFAPGCSFLLNLGCVDAFSVL